jgi:phenylacetate-CoA ligase
MPREELEQLQFERLQSTLNRVYRNVAFYRTSFDEHCVNLERIGELGALADLPFTTQADLQRSCPYGMFAVPLRDIVRIHSLPGPGGGPIVVGYTRNDLRHWTECAARLLAACGITEHDVVQIALDYNLYYGGFGFQQGAEQIGASVIPAGTSASAAKQLVVMRDFKTTALVTTPSHAASLADALDSAHLHPEQLHLRLGLLGGERFSDAARQQLEGRLHIRLSDTYGLTDVVGAGAAGECHLRQGLHVNEDHFLAEVIDPASLRAVPPGHEGELVLTTITKEGFPLIRYRTGDITSVSLDPCACGRTLARIARVRGRVDDMIVFGGASFFPSQVQAVLAEVGGPSLRFQVVLDHKEGADTLEVRVEVSDAMPSMDEPRALGALRTRIVRRLKEVLDVDAAVRFAEPRSLRQVPGENEQVVDRRLP